MSIAFIYDDGGRAAAGFKGQTGDCVTRAIAIATRIDYRTVYDELHRRAKRSPRDGIPRKVYDAYLHEQGWAWTPTMRIGEGCTVHLRSDELPPGRVIVRLSKHLAAVVNGVLRDTYDDSRGGTRCVYGYWTEEVEPA